MILSLLALSFMLKAQKPIAIQVMVMPPYSSALHEYIENPDKIIVTITHTGTGIGPLDIYLQGSIISDGGISAITEQGYKPPTPLTIQENSVYALTPGNMGDVFSLDHVDIEGIELEDLIDGGLPEDNYQICLEAYDYYTNEPLSEVSPLGCSNIFYIRNPEPPEILVPSCGDTIDGSMVNNIIISWTRPAGAPANTTFTLLMAEVPEGTPIIPEDIIATQLYPPVYEETTIATMLFLSPQQVFLSPGNTYAFVIRAEDPSGKILFNNNGMSEVCWFTWKEPNQFPWLLDSLEFIRPDSLIFPPHLAPVSIIGNLDFAYQSQNGEQAKYPLATTQVSIKPVYVLKNAEISDSKSPGVTTYDEYVMRIPGTFFTEEGLMNHSNYYYQDNFCTLATSVTSPQGDFAFLFTDTLSTGLVKEDFSATYTVRYDNEVASPPIGDPINLIVNPVINWGFNQLSNLTGIGFVNPLAGGVNVPEGGQQLYSGSYTHSVTYRGNLYRYYRVVVENKYYCSPEQNIYAPPGATINTGDMDCLVQTYDLNVKVFADSTIQEQAGITGEGLDQTKCFVTRKANTSYHIPPHEGMDLKTTKFFGYQQHDVVSEGMTETDGDYTFYNIVRDNNKISSDDLILYAETPTREGSYNYQPSWISYPGECMYHNPMDKPITWASYINGIYGYIFNNEYEYKAYNAEIYLSPDNPRIAGRVMHKSVPIQGALCYTNYSNDGDDYSDIDGLFSLDNLAIIDESRDLIIKKYGYEDYSMEAGRLIAGQQIYLNIEMIPWGLISGNIVGEDGKAVEAYVQIDDLNLEHTNRKVYFYPKYMAFERFLFRAPSGQRTLRIYPVSNDYLPFDTTLVIKKNTNPDKPQQLGEFVLKKNKHRIKFHVTYTPETAPGILQLNPVQVQNVRITVNNIVRYTDNQGMAQFEFASPETQFRVSVVAPVTTDLVSKDITVYSAPAPDFQEHEVELEMGYSLSGTVTGGQNNTPVADATVMPAAGGSKYLKTTTDSQGHYNLRGIPFPVQGNRSFKATAPPGDPTFVGEEKEISPGNQVLDFHLNAIDFMDISSLWGIPVELEKLYYQGREIFIDGAFVNLSGTNNFIPADPEQRIPFNGVHIKASGVVNQQGKPIAEPVDDEIQCSITGFDVKIFNQYDGKQVSAHRTSGLIPFGERFLRITKNFQNKGILKGRVYLLKSSFYLPAERFNTKDYENLNLCTSEPMYPYVISFLAPGGMQMTQQKLDIVDLNGEDPQFTINGFSARATDNSAKLKPAGIVMDIRLSPEYPLADFSAALEAQNVLIKKYSISDISSTESFRVGLENWQVQCPSGWNMPSGESQIIIPDAEIQTNLVNIEAGYMSLLPDRMDFHDLQYESMTLANVVPLDVEPGAESIFYLDPNANPNGGMHYVLKITGSQSAGYAASFAGLEGLPSGQRIKIPTMQLVSDDEIILSGFETLNEPLVFYDNLVLRLQMMAAEENFLKLTGLYDLNIPGLRNDMTANLKFAKDASGNAALQDFALNLSFDARGGVKFTALRPGNQQLTSQQYSADGILAVIDKGTTREISGTLYREKSGGPVYVTVTEPFLALGGSNDPRLKINSGEMRVKNNTWDYLWFEGPLMNTTGLSQNGSDQQTRFEVSGAINSDETSVSISDLDNFDGLVLTFDLERSEFIGKIIIPEFDMQFARFGGMLNTRFGSHGWYFMGCGTGSLPVLGAVKKMAVLLADYDDTNAFIEDLKQYTVRNNFYLGSSFSGIFLSAGKNDLFGLQLPNINLPTIPTPVGDISASLKWDALVGVDLKTTFADPFTYTMGTRGYISAQLKVSAPGVYAKGGVYLNVEGEGIINLIPPPSVSFYQCMETNLSGEIGGSVPGLGSWSRSVSQSFHAKLNINQSGFSNLGSIKFSVGTGGCQ